MNKLSFLVLLGTLTLSTAAHATVLMRRPLDALTQQSAVVVHGMVRFVNDHLTDDARGPFQTRIEIEVLRSLKGLDRDVQIFTLTLPGGRAGDKIMKVPGMPAFDEGDEVVLLLEKTKRGYIPTGWSQGVFRVWRRNGEANIVRPQLTARLVGPDGQAAAGYLPAPKKLDGLIVLLEALVAKPQTAPEAQP